MASSSPVAPGATPSSGGEPLVSILIPTYNGARYLRETLHTALNQTYPAIEVLVGDDASTDQTAKILARAAAADPRITVHRHASNLGPFENPVFLLRRARGEYVKFLLHDDLLTPQCVAALVHGMRRTPAATLAFSHRLNVDEHGRQVEGRQFERLSDTAGELAGDRLVDYQLEQCGNAIGEVSTCLFRRADVDPETLWTLDGRRLAGLGDLALWVGLLSRGSAFYDPRPLSSFRSHADQQSHDWGVLGGIARDWPVLVDWAHRAGFLARPEQEVRAYTAALRWASKLPAELYASPAGSSALEGITLAAGRLAELRADATAGVSTPLAIRAHDPEHRVRLSQEAGVWSRTFGFALASPGPVAAAVQAVTAAFQEIAAHGLTERFVIATPAQDLDAVVALAEPALATGPDLDVEVLVTPDPRSMLDVGVLAVAPPEATWHHGRQPGSLWTVHSDPT